MYPNSQCFLPLIHLLLLYLVSLPNHIYSAKKVQAVIRGRLARMICMQYNLEGNFTTTKPQPHKRPLYQIYDNPCRIIQRHICGDSNCQKFSSGRKKPCDENATWLASCEFGKYFEGDIVNPPARSVERNVYRNTSLRWPNRTKIGDDGGQVSPILPYEIGKDVPNEQGRQIKMAMAQIESCTCFRFEPRQASNPAHKDWLYIMSSEQGCFSSHIGRAGENQTVNVEYRCTVGIIVHELLHVIGFGHEHNRPDRDDYVTIFRENILPDYRRFFDKLNESEWNSFKESYDYDSIMHYPRDAFSSSDDKPTIAPKKNVTGALGQREGLSRSDIIQLNRMYGCADQSGPSCKPFPP